MDWTIKLGDMAIIVATLLGPVLAVQAQKWIERGRETQRRRISIFRTLMATRVAFVSPTHVEAVNAIPIEFYGVAQVVEAWKTYIDYLYQSNVDPNVWAQKRLDLFNELLTKLADFLGYKFNRAELSREIYSPRAHAMVESDQEIIRQGLAKLFRGEMALPMDVKSFPVDPEIIQNQRDLQKHLLKWLAGEQSVKVAIGKEGNQGDKT